MRPNLLLEGPGQQGIILSPHHYEEQRQVSPLAHPVPVQVNPGAHFVAKVAGVEGLRVQRQRLPRHRVLFPPLVVADLPDQSPVVARRLQHLEPQVHIRQPDLMDAQHVVVAI